jgi:predicted MFS family arabinose efflux permease
VTAQRPNDSLSRIPSAALLLRGFAILNFRRLWAGSVFWYTTRWMDMFVLQWLVLQMTGSAFQVSLVAFYRLFPVFLFGLLGGILADRVDRRSVLLAAQLWNALASVTLAVLVVTESLALWHLPILVGMLGVTWALDLPSRHSAIHDMAGEDGVVNAIALDLFGMNTAKLLGPILGGLLWPVLGTAGCMVLLTAGYLINFLNYLRLPSFPPPAHPHRAILRHVGEGISYAIRHPVILGVLAITVVLNSLAFPYQSIGPVVARDTLGFGPRLTGLLLSADGLGAMLVGLMIASRRDLVRPGRVFTLGSLAVLVGLLAFSVSRAFPFSWCALFLAGCGLGCFGTLQSPLILLSAPARIRGNIMGALMVAIGFGPLGVLQIGVLATLVGPAKAITITAGLGLLVAATVAWKARGLWNFRGADGQPGS